jgi:hypothetical protein
VYMATAYLLVALMLLVWGAQVDNQRIEVR